MRCPSSQAEGREQDTVAITPVAFWSDRTSEESAQGRLCLATWSKIRPPGRRPPGMEARAQRIPSCRLRVPFRRWR